MKKLFLIMNTMILVVVFWILFIVFYHSCSEASPFLVCDPQATVTHYKITGDAFWAGNIIAQVDGSIRSELATIPTGVHNIQVVACRTSDGWPEVCSTAAPFTFIRPGVPVIPTGIKLLP
jgi:hypothetical protein